MMKIVVAYKWTRDPAEATVRADGTVDWSRAKPGLSAYDPVAMELARQLAGAAGAELIGVTAGGKGVAVPIASKAALSRGLDRVGVVEEESLAEPSRSERAGLGVHPPVGHLLGPRGEQVVQLLQRLDALMGGLGQERLPDIAVQPLLLPPPFRRIRPGVHQPDAQHRACPRQPRVGERRSVVRVEH